MIQSLSQKAFDHIFEGILSGEIPPGTMLNRRSVAKELNMSPVPVMEAMVRLQSDGFLQTVQRKGTIVCGISPEEIKGYMFLREAIECQAARAYHGQKITKNEKQLLKTAEKFNQPAINTIEKFHIECAFHCQLVALADLNRITDIFEKAMRLILYYKLNKFHDNSDTSEYSDHVKLIELLKTTDRDQAEKYIRLHLNSDFYSIQATK